MSAQERLLGAFGVDILQSENVPLVPSRRTGCAAEGAEVEVFAVKECQALRSRPAGGCLLLNPVDWETLYAYWRSPRSAPAPDPVSHPAHYTQGKVECIDAIEAATTSLEGPAAFLAGTAIKYLWRWHHKRKPLEDLRKARWYLDRLIKHQEQAEGGGR